MNKQQNALQETESEREKKTDGTEKSPKQSCVKYENKARKSALEL